MISCPITPIGNLRPFFLFPTDEAEAVFLLGAFGYSLYVLGATLISKVYDLIDFEDRTNK